MARLPQSGSDDGAWGDILNNYLLAEHNSDGTHNMAAILQTPASGGLILASDPAAPSGFSWQNAHSLMPEEGVSEQVLMRVSDDANECEWRDVTKETIGLENVTNDLQLRAADLDADPQLTAASDTRIPSQGAVKQYVDTRVNTGTGYLPITGGRVEGGVAIAAPASASVPQLTLSPSLSTSGTALLYFNTERAWQFRQRAGGATAQLELNSTVNIKTFVVTSPAGVAALAVNVADNSLDSSVGVAGVLSVGGGMTVSGTATLSGGLVARRTPIGDIDYTISSTDYIVSMITLSAPRTITLPAGQPVGKTYVIKDESGLAATHNIIVVATGATIDGAANKVISTNYGSLKIYYNGTNWFIIS